MSKKTLFLTLLGVLILPAVASAQVTIEGMVANVAKVIYTVGGIIVIICWVIAGVLFATAQGAPEKMGLAKKATFAAIAGTIIVILAGAASTLISNALTGGT